MTEDSPLLPMSKVPSTRANALSLRALAALVLHDGRGVLELLRDGVPGVAEALAELLDARVVHNLLDGRVALLHCLVYLQQSRSLIKQQIFHIQYNQGSNREFQPSWRRALEP